MIIFAYCYLADIFVIAYMSVCPSVRLHVCQSWHQILIYYLSIDDHKMNYVFESGCGPSNRERMSPLEWLMLLHVNRHFMLVGGRTVVVFSIVFLKAPLRNYFLTESSPDKHHRDDTFCFDLKYICTNIEKVRDQITTQYKWQVIIRSFFANIYLFIRCCFLSDCGSFLPLNAEIGAIYDASYTQFRLLTIKISLFFLATFDVFVFKTIVVYGLSTFCAVLLSSCTLVLKK